VLVFRVEERVKDVVSNREVRPSGRAILRFHCRPTLIFREFRRSRSARRRSTCRSTIRG
jgi:hypothetical protein